MKAQAKNAVATTAKNPRAPRKAAAKPPVKKGAIKSAAAKPIAVVKPKTPAKTPVKVTGATLKLVTPKKNWKIAFRDASVNGAITYAIGDGAHTLDALVTYFEEHSGMAPNKSAQYKNKPKQYIADYITYLVKEQRSPPRLTATAPFGGH